MLPAMQTTIAKLLAALAAGVLLSCAGGGGGGNMGDMGGADPPEGGISEVPNANPTMAARSGKSLEQLQRGHELYMLNCAQCHRYRLPKDINVPAWQAGRLRSDCGVDINAGDQRMVVDYISAVKAL